MPSTSNQYFSLGLQFLIMPLQLRKSRYKNQKKHFRLYSCMCTEHNTLKTNSNMELIQILLLQLMWSTVIQKQISNDKWLITTTTTFNSAALDCINELCSAIDIAVATVHKNLPSHHKIETFQFGRMEHAKFIAWSKWKIWRPKQHEITATILPHKILQLQLLG